MTYVHRVYPVSWEQYEIAKMVKTAGRVSLADVIMGSLVAGAALGWVAIELIQHLTA